MPKSETLTPIKVFVRRVHGSEDDERTIAVQRPDEIPSEEWIKHGYAIDGNSAVSHIQARGLVGVERDLLAFLKGYGFTADFQ